MQTRSRDTWRAHPVLGALLRVAVLLVPLLAGVGTAVLLTRVLPPSQDLGGRVLWWSTVLTGSLVALALTDRLARRLLPLAVLLELSLVFPDRAPSRLRAARTPSVREMETVLARLHGRGAGDDASEAAETLVTLVGILGLHDARTRGHSERVRAFTDLLTEELGLPEEERRRARWAALVHDIGKLDVPGEVLNGGRELSDDAWAQIRRHPEEGVRLAAGLLPWLGEWGRCVLEHHERYDGGGYPRGLAGEQISREARIVSVCDSFEVMTAARSYNTVRSAGAARAELIRCAGTQFDPEVVRAFVGISLGRVLWVLGPLTWLAQLPFVAAADRAGQFAKAGAAAVVVGGLVGGGLVPGPAGPVAAERPAVRAPASAGPAAEEPDGPAGAGRDAVVALPVAPRDARPGVDAPAGPAEDTPGSAPQPVAAAPAEGAPAVPDPLAPGAPAAPAVSPVPGLGSGDGAGGAEPAPPAGPGDPAPVAVDPSAEPAPAPGQEPAPGGVPVPSEAPAPSEEPVPSEEPAPSPEPGPPTGPGPAPSAEPVPSAEPSAPATEQPSAPPTEQPAPAPTRTPAPGPSAAPTGEPTGQPTATPTSAPTPDPTDPTGQPTTDPTTDPTAAPTTDPTTDPTTAPTTDPTADPTAGPSPAPAPTTVRYYLAPGRALDDTAPTASTPSTSTLSKDPRVVAVFARTLDTATAVSGSAEVLLYAQLSGRRGTAGQRTGQLAVALESCPADGGACAPLSEGREKADQDDGESGHTARAVLLDGVGGVVPAGGVLRLTVALEQGNADTAELQHASADRPARLVLTTTEQARQPASGASVVIGVGLLTSVLARRARRRRDGHAPVRSHAHH